MDSSKKIVETNKVVEYFEKFSRNSELSKYFTGEEAGISKQQEPEGTRAASPTPSIDSHKKLEWDSGADIGYRNSFNSVAKKSASFPSFFSETDHEKAAVNKDKMTSDRNKYHQLTYFSQNSDSSKSSSDEPQLSIHSAGSSNSKSSSNKRIGSPKAFSTPYSVASDSKSSDDALKDTPIQKSEGVTKKKLNPDAPKKISTKYIRSNVIDLRLTTPMTLECCDENKQMVDKTSQTSLNTAESKSIQTESCSQLKLESKKSTPSELQPAIYVKHKEPDVEKSSADDESDSSTQISLQYSTDLSTDIKRSIDILQKLAKTKKYDDSTKKRYIRKIVEKIVHTKYDDDTTTSDTKSSQTTKAVPKVSTKTTKSEDEKNWKEMKTLSEKLVENGAKIKPKHDYLLQVASKERQHQLSWINSEIDYLTKLKEMLEKKKPEKGSLAEKLGKLSIRDNSEVYVESSRYNIKTKLDEDGHLIELILFDDKGVQKYCYRRNENYQWKDEPKSIKKYADEKTQTDVERKTTKQYKEESKEKSSAQVHVDKTTATTSGGATQKKQTAAGVEKKKGKESSIKQPDRHTRVRGDVAVNTENETSVCVSTQCRNTTPQRDGEAQHPQAKTVASQTQKPDNEERGEQSDETASHRSSQSSDSSKSLIPCVCCKKNRIIKKLLQGAAASPLCDTCLTVSRKCCYPYDYSNPRHNCMCYYVENETAIDQLENALCQLERLEGYQQLCDVIENCNCCGGSSCKCKLPKRLKNGCAYFLKVEMERPKRVGGKSGANGKDDSSDGGDSEDKENVLPEVVIKVPTIKKEAKRKKDNYQSIQNYLCAMKPDFVERAEMRRKTLRDAALQREEKVERRKLRFIDHPSILDPHPKKVKPKVFKNFKEMKELTRRKYLHLNEVKSVKEMYKERRLREANRLVADIFTKRLQRSTLKGNVDIPLNVRVVSY